MVIFHSGGFLHIYELTHIVKLFRNQEGYKPSENDLTIPVLAERVHAIH